MRNTKERQAALVGIDGSPHSEAALRWAVAAARLENRPVTAMLAWTAYGLPRPVYRAVLAADHNGLTHAAERMLEQVIARVPNPDPAVGTRGRGGFAELVLGSTTHQCVLHSSCPVAVIHARRR